MTFLIKDLLVLFHFKVPNPNYVILPSRRQLRSQPILSHVDLPTHTSQIYGSAPTFVGGVFAPVKRESGGTTSVNGAPTELDKEPPLVRYTVSKPKSGPADAYGLVEVP